ncbi:MAG: hypothetical protein EOL95_08715 [Bacteroidia bacterium]|nr:hypothetical protein [Bacteroidia bacterium]
MKTKRILSVIALAVVSFATVQAQQVLCPSTANYDINPNNPTSTYDWTLTGGVDNTDYVLGSATGTSNSVQWITPGNYSLTAQETTDKNCKGPIQTVTVTVSEFPIVADDLTTICSTNSVQTDVVALNLATTGTNGATVNKWDITASVPAGITGTATTGTGLTSATAIASDTFTNTTSADLDVVYTITPYAGTCPGTPYTVTVKVLPDVLAPTITF